MKRVKMGCVLLGMLMLAGCSQQVSLEVADKEAGSMKITTEKLTERELTLMHLTDNRVLLYTLEGLPTDVPYELVIKYEVYEDGEKVKEEMLLQQLYEGLETSVVVEGEEEEEVRMDQERESTLGFGLNIKDDSIHCMTKSEQVIASRSMEIDPLEGLGGLFWQSETTFDMNEPIYLYHEAGDYRGLDEEGGFIELPMEILGNDMTQQIMDDLMEQSKTNVFITMQIKSYEE